ncbi:MAG: epoxyqueuosine reductase QueH [Epsilonproteobacteria bacterium]|nr:epoxyqueuosine reductase QueH [Campylobacterota bacterium]
MVVHLCCSVDAGYFLKRLKEEFKEEKLIGYFYDPNIHPYSEYKLRALDTKRICQKEGVEFIEGEYDFIKWYEMTKGLENEPEKGKRCSVCFDISLEESAKFAKSVGEKRITTSLLMSPKKSHSQLQKTGDVIKRKYGIDFVIVDFRKKGGTQAQQEYSKKHSLYRQDYCGCMYALIAQRKGEFTDELISPYPFNVLPSSVEEKIDFYKKSYSLTNYRIKKEKFLNYRLLNSTLFHNKTPQPHYTLFYSLMERKQRLNIEFEKEGIFYANRAEVLFVDIGYVNRALDTSYESIKDIYSNPLSIEDELILREKITSTKYSLSPVIIVDEVKERYEVSINAKIYPDTREILIKF